MARIANRFIDPRTAFTYDWPVNHETEETFGRDRQITNGANTGNVGVLPVQGDMQPFTLALTGKLRTQDQRNQMWAWFQLCQSQTIHFRDVEGSVFEVIITSFNPTRVRVMRNLNDIVNAETWIWNFTIRMQVLRFVSGPLAAVLTA